MATLDLNTVLALAPEKKRQDRARKLAIAVKWNALNSNDDALWGEAPSSGKKVYNTWVDLSSSDVAYKCNCPSREHPCKHTLALMMLYVAAPTDFTEGTPPTELQTWLDKRASKKANAKPRKVNPKTMQKRQQEIETGLDELDLWLRDLVRAGLASLQGKPKSFYENPAKRLQDAKAPTLAERVSALAKIPATGEGWADRMLRELAQVHLIIEGFRRFDQLPPTLQGDIRTAVGWHVREAELTETSPVTDTWLVLGVRRGTQEKLKVQRLWMHGLETGRNVLLLDFAVRQNDFTHRYLTGEAFEADVVFYPSAYPLRGVVKERRESTNPPPELPGYGALTDAIDAYAEALAHNPWTTQFPVAFREVVPVRSGKTWQIVDEFGGVLPVSSEFKASWELFTISGGRPLWLFGEWDGSALHPLAVSQSDKIITLQEGN
ncbi:MAG: SWIM zinc finger family protein [Chloroflexota bacterium]